MLLREALAVLTLLVAGGRFTAARTLLQRNTGTSQIFATYLYSPTASGGLSLVSNYTVVRTSTSVTTRAISTSRVGQVLSLQEGSILNSNSLFNVGCLEGRLNTSSDGVASFLTTYADYLAMYNGEIYNLIGGYVYGNLNLSSSQPGPLKAKTNPSEVYTIITYSLGRRPTTASYTFTAYPPGAPECEGVAPAPTQELLGSGRRKRQLPAVAPSVPGAPPAPGFGLFPGKRLLAESGQFALSPSSASAPTAGLVQSAQIRKIVAVSGDNVYGLVAFTNASCIAYRARAQPPTLLRTGAVDLTTLIIDRTNLLKWAAQDFLPDARGIQTGAECLQNNAKPGACGAYLDKLNASETYFIIGAGGLQNPESTPDEALLEVYYTAQASGSCANNVVQVDQSSSYYGQDGEYSYDSSYYDSSYEDSNNEDSYDDYGDSPFGNSPFTSSPPPSRRGPPPHQHSLGVAVAMATAWATGGAMGQEAGRKLTSPLRPPLPTTPSSRSQSSL